MLSKNKIKYIQSLSRKKVRDLERAFLVEGNKMVLEAISSNFPIELIAGTSSFFQESTIPDSAAAELIECNQDDLNKASLLKNPQQALAILQMPDNKFQLSDCMDHFSLAMDSIQDPGNLGTIIRIADWFGIEHILCSKTTADCFNPKVIQASMGAIFRVKVQYLQLQEILIEAAANHLPVYGTFLEGKNIYESQLSSKGILVMGNEGHGISEEIAQQVGNKLHIPSFQSGASGSESLNVATATAICCSEFKRRAIG